MVKERHEDVRVVVGLFGLDDGHQALEAHPTIHVTLGQQLQLRRRLPRNKKAS